METDALMSVPHVWMGINKVVVREPCGHLAGVLFTNLNKVFVPKIKPGEQFHSSSLKAHVAIRKQSTRVLHGMGPSKEVINV